MTFLAIRVDPQLTVGLLNYERTPTIDLNGQSFTLRQIGEESVFYDWFASPTGVIQALDIHLSATHPVLRTSVSVLSLSHVDTRCFFVLWFTPRRDAAGIGKEAFGDIYFFGGPDEELAILVGIHDWLSPMERASLLREFGLLTLYESGKRFGSS
jgi:hypothetical protein